MISSKDSVHCRAHLCRSQRVIFPAGTPCAGLFTSLLQVAEPSGMRSKTAKSKRKKKKKKIAEPGLVKRSSLQRNTKNRHIPNEGIFASLCDCLDLISCNSATTTRSDSYYRLRQKKSNMCDGNDPKLNSEAHLIVH